MDTPIIHEWSTFKRIVEERANRAVNLSVRSELMSLIWELEERQEYDMQRMDMAALEPITDWAELE